MNNFVILLKYIIFMYCEIFQKIIKEVNNRYGIVILNICSKIIYISKSYLVKKIHPFKVYSCQSLQFSIM